MSYPHKGGTFLLLLMLGIGLPFVTDLQKMCEEERILVMTARREESFYTIALKKRDEIECRSYTFSDK